MPTSWSSLYLSWTEGMTDYIAQHIANYSRIQTCLDYLYALSGGGRTMLDVPLGLQEIFDRDGLIGKDAYLVSNGVLGSPYNLIVGVGAVWVNDTFYYKETSTTISLATAPTDTYYINLDAAGNPSISDNPGSVCIRQFDWNLSSHTISNSIVYSGINILFDGDDYADCLTSTALSLTFTSMAARFENIETALGNAGMSSFFEYDVPGTSGLNFAYKAGLVRNDNVIWSVVAGTVLLIASDTNYVEVNPADGTVSANIVGFTTERIPLYSVVTNVSTITGYTDFRTWCAAGGGGGGGGHTQNTDVGTTSAEFKLLMGVVGAPTSDAYLKVERGTSPDVGIRWNETTEKWEYTEDGSTWNNMGELNVDLGAQQISRFIPISDPPLVHEELGRGSSIAYEEIDLTSFLTDAPDGIDGALLRVVYWDTENPPTIASNVRFRKGGIAEVPMTAFTIYSPAQKDWSRPQTLILGASSSNIIEFFLNASGVDTSNIRVYLAGYFKIILGVGTQNVSFASSGLAVPANSAVDFNLTGFNNRSLIHYFKIEEVADLITGDFDVEVFKNDTFGVLEYKLVGIHFDDVYEDYEPWMHEDGDDTSELHIRITNKDLTQAATFDINIRCEMFA